MKNPWLAIPLADYEGHMRSPQVQQADALSNLFAEAVGYCHPASVAILGITGGNELSRLDDQITLRIVGLDVNPLYLDAVRQRYGHLQHLQLYCCDLTEQVLGIEPVDLVHAALVFEHAGVGQCLDNALSLMVEGGTLSVVLQLPSKSAYNVGISEYSTIQSLAPHFSLVDPCWFSNKLADRQFRLRHQTRLSVSAGKELWMGIFGR